jgi:hypothetical protein
MTLADVMKIGSLWRQPLADVMKIGSLWRQPMADVMKIGSLWRQPMADVMKIGSLWRQPMADVIKIGSLWRQPMADVIKTNKQCDTGLVCFVETRDNISAAWLLFLLPPGAAQKHTRPTLDNGAPQRSKLAHSPLPLQHKRSQDD